ncbi:MULTISPECIES: SAM-dependent methyltransferase [Kitasatospora]|uniref:SAM-dependent methyltransferase n=2 Tax=Kitasatospora TaxID=2063 RepID=A0ABT1J487_9ACTN|nr:class I SAM-dependent methyltransferase [Kitasatospora paracochleata]MCP2312237.1 SAM-dependent methyltransferase [Kitasatospora paracochleata]
MDRHLISRIAHRDHPIAAPLSDESVRRLLDRALRGGTAERVLDLGCGEGAWLLRALAAHPQLRAVGVDLDAHALNLARQGAERLGVARRIGLHHVDAKEFAAKEEFDAVLCVGATHAFGGLLPTLAAVRPHLAPGGLALVGEGYWQAEPDRAALDIFGDGLADLHATVDHALADGWTPVYGHTSTQEELDDYEWSWTGSLADWALDHAAEPSGGEALRIAAEHRAEWLGGYRPFFGFVTLVLRRTA